MRGRCLVRSLLVPRNCWSAGSRSDPRTCPCGTRDPIAGGQVILRLHRIPPAEPESLEITAFNVRMAKRTRDKVRHFAAMFKAPTEDELSCFRCPRNCSSFTTPCALDG